MQPNPKSVLPPSLDNLPTGQGQQTRTPARIPAERLFQGSQEIRIDHNGEAYRLRITRNDKLILTK